jgi:cytoplasmic iron level regulating protein YaaA (DUF328/UPF0246 family)
MYSSSDLFRKAYAYSIKNYDVVAILSAKYGLLLPEDKIEPYDLTLNDMNSREVREWSEKVFNQMRNRLRLSEFSKVFFHAGTRYRKHLIPKLDKIGLRSEAPLSNLRIGKQKAWYLVHDC